ncbi:LOW QUALITY PROTEIN: dynactin subunit 2-like [Rhopalosiphum padi]|uniref:LOW QUALITY PROTEIN: dynactin subunit 2-like n=1 Tax=Rhopalosiphum padi TaxID=40932 RepID=UPI00298EC6B5|nr:LOW QUALITY PROTEIN: dynactin subunit 2-like [Rhopalosiphum padi]
MIESEDAQFNGSSSWKKLKKRPRQFQEKWNTLAIFKDDKILLMKFDNPAFNQSETDIADKNQNYNIKKEIEDINSNIQTNGVCGPYKHFVDSSNIDFSSDILDTFRKSYKIKYVFRNEYWELAAQGERETPLQKYYRLKFETEDLLIQESIFQVVDENDHNEKLWASIRFQIQKLLNKLSSVDGHFKLLESYKTTITFNLQNFIITKFLENRLSGIDKEQPIFINNMSKLLNIKVTLKDLKPSTLKTVQLLQISRLEERLQKLEEIIGSEKSILMRLAGINNNVGLVEAVSVLKGLSKLILPQINLIESRAIYLLPKIQEITSKQVDQRLEVDKKTNKLYETIVRAREESNLLPYVIQRMNILDIFRHKVKTFSVTMNNLNIEYSETSKILKKNELLLNNIETHIPKHLTSVVSNLQSLNAQIKVFANRLKNIEV